MQRKNHHTQQAAIFDVIDKWDIAEAVKLFPTQYSQKNVDGETPIVYAARHGYWRLVYEFSEKHVDTNHSADFGCALYYVAKASPFHINSRDKLVKQLIEKNADLNYQHPENGDTALHLAVRHADTNTVNALANAFANYQLKNKAGFSAMTEASSQLGKFGKSHYRNALINIVSLPQGEVGEDYGTALHHAIAAKDVDVTEALLKAGAPFIALRQGPNKGYYPLHVMAKSKGTANDKKIIALLLQYGADPLQKTNPSGRSFIEIMLSDSKTDYFQLTDLWTKTPEVALIKKTEQLSHQLFSGEVSKLDVTFVYITMLRMQHLILQRRFNSQHIDASEKSDILFAAAGELIRNGSFQLDRIKSNKSTTAALLFSFLSCREKMQPFVNAIKAALLNLQDKIIKKNFKAVGMHRSNFPRHLQQIHHLLVDLKNKANPLEIMTVFFNVTHILKNVGTNKWRQKETADFYRNEKNNLHLAANKAYELIVNKKIKIDAPTKNDAMIRTEANHPLCVMSPWQTQDKGLDNHLYPQIYANGEAPQAQYFALYSQTNINQAYSVDAHDDLPPSYAQHIESTNKLQSQASAPIMTRQAVTGNNKNASAQATKTNTAVFWEKARQWQQMENKLMADDTPTPMAPSTDTIANLTVVKQIPIQEIAALPVVNNPFRVFNQGQQKPAQDRNSAEKLPLGMN